MTTLSVLLAVLKVGVAYDAEGLDVAKDGITCSEVGTTVFSAPFNDKAFWSFRNFQNALDFRPTTESLYIGGSTAKCDTAWCIYTKQIPLVAGSVGYRLSFKVRALGCRVQNPAAVSHRWGGGLFWYDRDGKEIFAEPVVYFASACNAFESAVRSGGVPSGAAFFSVQLGFDGPNIGPGESMELKDLRFEVTDGSHRLAKSGRFVSEVRPGGRLSWVCETPAGTSVRFRTRGAATARELFSKPFTDDLAVTAPYMQYEATLISDGVRSPVLKSVSAADWTDASWTIQGDGYAPYVTLAHAPGEDASAPFELSVTDSSVVDWSSLKLTVDGAAAAYDLRGGEIVSVRPPAGGWRGGSHTAEVAVADCRGLATRHRKLFYVGEMPKTPKVTLRDDGFVLIDGKPFFPIGPYAVCKREFNGMDFDIAFEGLKAGGFNFAHTYGNAYDPEFLAAAKKHGFKLWVQARFPDRNFIEKGRFNPSILAWYLGDDTSDHIPAAEELDYHDAVKAFDPTRITCQADPILAGADGANPNVCSVQGGHSRYTDYVGSTDVFMPEIYPVRHQAGDSTDRICVAETIRDMKQFAADVERHGNGAPKSCWPIIQYFDGWGSWRHFPSRDQLFGMTWASVIHGAHGVTWYTYGGFYSKKYKRLNSGITSSPERWKNICDLATQLNELSPVLLERKGAQPPVPAVTKGPKADPLGHPSVTCLVKRHDGATYVFAVNAAPEAVSARIDLNLAGEAEALYENGRRLAVSGSIADDFRPFGVHIYRIGTR